MNDKKCTIDSFSVPFGSSFFTRIMSCFKSLPLTEYAAGNTLRFSSDKNMHSLRQNAEIPKKITEQSFEKRRSIHI